MRILLTEAAVNKLKASVSNEGKFPRIDANISGGCGLAVNLSIIFDEPRRYDSILENKGVQIRIDHFTKRYLNEEIHIDYTNEQGFLFGERFESGACTAEMP
ncbi:iron-sulfur cluster biosynthesis family protein [Domibacillus mangrovi]|uniref:Core domain-containing protein n=1 Tax=Domibacillus mangrovi TaxID=1714354 RepID=A0A1Q5P4Y3_9BACI|nr:iron-sulfur cluster biosynthesis family protein [Domibacillus mangrovi]OKL37329.1 hypothetical protein BLL40_07075 [Domibacillus mangrovi]